MLIKTNQLLHVLKYTQATQALRSFFQGTYVWVFIAVDGRGGLCMRLTVICETKRNETKWFFEKWYFAKRYFAKGYFAKWYFAKRYFAKWHRLGLRIH